MKKAIVAIIFGFFFLPAAVAHSCAGYAEHKAKEAAACPVCQANGATKGQCNQCRAAHAATESSSSSSADGSSSSTQEREALGGGGSAPATGN